MKKFYSEPQAQFLYLDRADVIRASSSVDEPDCDVALDVFF